MRSTLSRKKKAGKIQVTVRFTGTEFEELVRLGQLNMRRPGVQARFMLMNHPEMQNAMAAKG